MALDDLSPMAVGTWLPGHCRAKAEEFMRIQAGEVDEFRSHASSMAGKARRIAAFEGLSPVGGLKKTKALAFHGITHSGKPLFRTSLDHRNARVEHSWPN
jgi:hypothetical protein